jgi:hypothetical protein
MFHELLKLLRAAATALAVGIMALLGAATGVYANGASASAGAQAGASASAGGSGGNTFVGAAGVGGAYCTKGVVFGPVGAYGTLEDCLDRDDAFAMQQLCGHVRTAADMTAACYHLARTNPKIAQSFDDLGIISAIMPGERSAGSTSGGATGQAEFPNITGAWVELTRAQQTAIVQCEARWNGNGVRGCEGQYSN